MKGHIKLYSTFARETSYVVDSLKHKLLFYRFPKTNKYSHVFISREGERVIERERDRK